MGHDDPGQRAALASPVAQAHAASTLNSIGDAVLATDTCGCVSYLNLAAETMTGWSREEASGRPLPEVFRLVDHTPTRVLIRRDGREVPIEHSVAPIRDADGHVTGAVIVFRDVGAALETSRLMSHLAQHDSLTGLPNRALLYDRLSKAIDLALRRNEPLAVLFLDVDDFKAVNDSLGHAAGDRVLASIAARLAGALRESDTVSRYSGDEFVIILPEIEHAEDAAPVAAKLIQAVARPHQIDGRKIKVTASIGVALFPTHGQNSETLITNADTAMYQAKRAGPGHCRLFDVGRRASDRLVFEVQIPIEES